MTVGEREAQKQEAVTYWSRLLLGMWLLNCIAFGFVWALWPQHIVAMFGGWALSWLTAVAWVGLQEARRV